MDRERQKAVGIAIAGALPWGAASFIYGSAVYRRHGLGLLIVGILMVPVVCLAGLWWVVRKERLKRAKR
jgi:hypothetical protein